METVSLYLDRQGGFQGSTEDVDLSIKVPDKGEADVRDRAQVIMRMTELGIISIAAEYNGKGKKYLQINNKKTPEV